MKVIVNVDVPDLDAGIGFYEQGLGLALARRLFEGTVAEMTGGGVTVHLLEKAAGSAAPKARDYARHWTPVHFDLVVDDLDEAVRRATAAGAKLEAPLREYDWGRLALLADPFGHGFCLLDFSGEGY